MTRERAKERQEETAREPEDPAGRAARKDTSPQNVRRMVPEQQEEEQDKEAKRGVGTVVNKVTRDGAAHGTTPKGQQKQRRRQREKEDKEQEREKVREEREKESPPGESETEENGGQNKSREKTVTKSHEANKKKKLMHWAVEKYTRWCQR